MLDMGIKVPTYLETLPSEALFVRGYRVSFSRKDMTAIVWRIYDTPVLVIMYTLPF